MRPRLVLVVFLAFLKLGKVVARFDDGYHSTTRTYDVEVPGSKPIRIIDTEPLWGRKHADVVFPITTTEKAWTDREHRALNSEFYGKQELGEDEEGVTQADSAEELRKFLKMYTQKGTRSTKSPFDKNEPPGGLHKIELITKSPEEEQMNRLTQLYLNHNKNGESSALDDDDNGKTWNLLNLNRQKYPFEPKDNWVSLEVVPWSISKVSRWHSNRVNIPTVQQKPWDNPYSDSLNNKKPSFNYVTKPYSLPTTTYSQKVYLQDYSQEIPKPNFPNKYPHVQDAQEIDVSCTHERPGIITDGLPPNFPKPLIDHNRRRGDQNAHPPTHPFNGNGEWVLLTTTKGYKIPVNQRTTEGRTGRALNQDTIATRKSVRLTVLPPLKNSNVNMTTSHGGLLQVESTFQSVDEAQKNSLKKLKPVNKRPPKKHKPVKSASPMLNQINNLPSRAINTKTKQPSPSSVLAAVGAGMIPATMAMLVPMMGKRRRRDLSPSSNLVALEINLQRLS